MNEIHNRLKAIRNKLKDLEIDAWFISGTDPHGSEYLPDRWQTRKFISGFTGSYGIVVVTLEHAALWTDTRYFIQAESELQGTGIEMRKLRVSDSITPEEWIAEKLPGGSKIGIDPKTVSVNIFRNLRNSLDEKRISIESTPDLFENVWPDRPKLSDSPVFDFDISFSGVSRTEKQTRVAEKLETAGADFLLVTMLDELAWLFNLRGYDIKYNPVFTGFGLIGKKQNHLFVDKIKLQDDLIYLLEKEGIILHPYHQFIDFLGGLKGYRILLDPGTANYLIYQTLERNNKIIETVSPVALMKSCKNETELQGFRKAMLKDGVALVEFLFWLKETVGKRNVNEYEIGSKLAELRALQNNFMGESFAPIVGYKEHGAIVHLSVTPENAKFVEPDGILLFDSGGQYLDGTTDITRTVALGEISEQQKIDFTLVLKGMIDLSMAIFPVGTKGCHLDILARKPLWEKGLNYGHGTGHGVGHFLSVHEGPMAIRQEYNENRLEPGQVLSNEPAFYREGEYGIRTENMMVCIEKENTPFGKFLGFETLSICPIDTRLVKAELLTEVQIDWLNEYHSKVKQVLKPLLRKDLHEFLDELTKSI